MKLFQRRVQGQPDHVLVGNVARHVSRGCVTHLGVSGHDRIHPLVDLAMTIGKSDAACAPMLIAGEFGE